MNTDLPDYDPKVYRPFFDLSPRPLPQRFRVWAVASEAVGLTLTQAGRLREMLPVLQHVPINVLYKQLRNGEQVELGIMYDWEIDELRNHVKKEGLSIALQQEHIPDPAL